MDIKEFAQKFIEAEEAAFQRGEFEELEQIESPDVVIHLQPPITIGAGFEGHKQYIINARQNNTISQEFEYLVGDGNVCAISLAETITLGMENPAMSLTAGATIVVDALMVLRLENERVAEIWIKGSFAPRS